MGCHMAIGFAELVLGAASVWRITHLLHAEDGPSDALARLRKLAGQGAFGKMLDCFYCVSVWVALPIAFALSAVWKERVLLWAALSGAAICWNVPQPGRSRMLRGQFGMRNRDDRCRKDRKHELLRTAESRVFKQKWQQ